MNHYPRLGTPILPARRALREKGWSILEVARNTRSGGESGRRILLRSLCGDTYQVTSDLLTNG